jgi:hypothetical protein
VSSTAKARTNVLSECRECCSFCDRLIHPSGCVESGCRYLYLYDEEQTGRRYMGCLNKVFKVEIDVELFEMAEQTHLGFGGVKMTGDPLPQCRSSVERAYHGDSDAFECVNPGFFDPPAVADRLVAKPADGVGPGFDLRDSL